MFLTNEQKVVVQARVKMGCESELLSNGNWLIYKGKHTMIINNLGYDVYIKKGMM